MEKRLSDIVGEFLNNLLPVNLNKEFIPKLIENVFAFVGMRGGIGTSTIVYSLAHVYKRMGLEVLVIDANLSYPVQHILFGLDIPYNKEDIIDVLSGRAEVGRALLFSKEDIALLHGFKGILDVKSVDNLNSIKYLSQLLRELRKLFDIILIDSSINIDNAVINSLLFNADRVFIIAGNDIISYNNFKSFIRNSESIALSLINKGKVILNKYENSEILFDKSLIFETINYFSNISNKLIDMNNLNIDDVKFIKNIEVLADKVLEEGGVIDYGVEGNNIIKF